MKINGKWFTVTLVLVGFTPSLILFIWCSVNGFGSELVGLFETIHPNGGYSIIAKTSNTIAAKTIAVTINSLYVIVDLVILGVAFSFIYNFFIERSERS